MEDKTVIELYKIVRDNYTDCHSGTVKYVVGNTFVHPSPVHSLCAFGVYHACRKPEQALAWRNGQWPLRLLKVHTPEVIVEDTRRGDEKCGVHELTVIEELSIASAFGPQGQKVIDFINHLSSIKWLDPQNENEHEKVKQLIEKNLSILGKFGAKQVPVKFTSDWDAARDAARDAAWAAAWAAARDAAWAAARDAAWAAARDAARAAARAVSHIVVEDLVDFENPFTPLMEVWELGYWPIGVVDGEFLVFERETE